MTNDEVRTWIWTHSNFELRHSNFAISQSRCPNPVSGVVQAANKINVPVLVLHGNNDRLVLPDHAWKMSEALFLHQKEHDIVILYSPEEDTGHNLKGKALEQAHEQALKWLNKYLFPDKKK